MKLTDEQREENINRIIREVLKIKPEALQRFEELLSSEQAWKEENAKLVKEIEDQVKRNDKQRAAYFKVEKGLFQAIEVLKRLKAKFETENSDAFPTEECASDIDRFLSSLQEDKT